MCTQSKEYLPTVADTIFSQKKIKEKNNPRISHQEETSFSHSKNLSLFRILMFFLCVSTEKSESKIGEDTV